MSERDCGSWYCQKAPGHEELQATDVRLFPGLIADDHDKKECDREREQVKEWMTTERVNGFEGWLAAPHHGSGAAKHYWVWDPDSREKYMEFKEFETGEVPEDFGDLHRGMGWQLPLLAVINGEPTFEDLVPLRRNGVPCLVLEEEEGEWVDLLGDPDPVDDITDMPIPPPVIFVGENEAREHLLRAQRQLVKADRGQGEPPLWSHLKNARRQIKKAMRLI